MLRNVFLILFTICLIGKTTDVASLLVAKQKSLVVCDTGTCDNETTEVEKSNDDQVIASHSLHLEYIPEAALLKTAFTYTPDLNSEISRNLTCPPPELS